MYRATRSNTNNRPALNLPSGSDSQGRASVESRANPVNPVQLAFYLRGYINSISDYLIQGFVHGFPIRYLGSLIAMRSQNLKSAKDNPTSVTEKLSKERTGGRIVGSFDVPPFDPFRVPPLGIIPKRLIHHLSYPAGSSVNDGIPKELATVRYATTDDAIRLVKSLGKGCFLAKTDIKSAFRIIFVSPNDFPLLELFYQSQCDAVARYHNDIRDNIFNLDPEALPRSMWLWYYETTANFEAGLANALQKIEKTFRANLHFTQASNDEHYLCIFYVAKDQLTMMDATHNGWGTVQEMQLPLTQPNYITLMRHGQQL